MLEKLLVRKPRKQVNISFSALFDIDYISKVIKLLNYCLFIKKKIKKFFEKVPII